MSDIKNNSKLSLGIDLGSSYSAVSVYQNGSCNIICNEQGNRITPSVVAFTDDEILVGESARNQASFNPENTIFVIKRLMGVTFNDPKTQEYIKTLPYKVIDRDNKPVVQVQYKKETKEYTPEQISAMILSKMKKIAETFLGEKVTKAVITVPAYYGDPARQSVKDASVIAGIECIRIINEPTSASLCYGFDKSPNSSKTIQAVDLGGLTYDCSTLSIDDGIFEVLSTCGDLSLGGEDFDNRILDFCVKEFKKKHKKDLRKDPRSIRRLRTACERAKVSLSTVTNATIEVDSLYEGIDFSATITRARFENLCVDIFRKCLDKVEQSLKDAKLSKSQIDEIVLVGGSSRMPYFQKMLSDYFNGKKLCKSVNPDEAVAIGAGILANSLTGGSKDNDLLVLDVCPLNLGIETAGQVMTVMIPKNTTIPTEKKQTFSTYQDNQPGANVVILEGFRKFSKDCNKIGEFLLEGFPPMPRGTPQIEVTYALDANCILKVTAVEKSTGVSKEIEVKGTTNNLSKDDIDRMVKEAEEHAKEDEEKLNKITARNSLETYCYQIKNSLNDEKIKDKFSEEDKKLAEDTVTQAIEWIDQNSSADKEDYEKKQKEVEAVVMPIMAKIYQDMGAGGGMPGMPGMPDMSGMNMPDMSGMSPDGPKVAEVD